MVSANVDLVRAMYADWERGDYSSVAWADPEIEFVISDGPSPGMWQGLAGLAVAWRGFLGAWELWRVEADQFYELDDERVLAVTHFMGRGKASGVEVGEVPTRGASLAHIRDGRVTRLVLYFDAERALAELEPAADHG